MKIKFMDFYADVRITQRPTDAYASGPPEDCYPSECGEFEIENLLDEDGRDFKCDYLLEQLLENRNFNTLVWEEFEEENL